MAPTASAMPTHSNLQYANKNKESLILKL